MKKKFGKLQSKFNFSLNPYPELRFSTCPDCEKKTGQRKVPLFIHVEPHNPIFLNYTNKYCSHCDMLIGHKHEIEHLLRIAFEEINSDIIGNSYMLIGTVENKVWKGNLVQKLPLNELRNYVHDFKSIQTISMTIGGWFLEGKEPPVMEAPASTEWVKDRVYSS